jgi:fluoride ion exporter CrcB/FEX|tara:strand:- start:21 stop:257 length:237 start_codon:yes stop_codon:yes gene_type:complete
MDAAHTKGPLCTLLVYAFGSFIIDLFVNISLLKLKEMMSSAVNKSVVKFSLIAGLVGFGINWRLPLYSSLKLRSLVEQ